MQTNAKLKRNTQSLLHKWIRQKKENNIQQYSDTKKKIYPIRKLHKNSEFAATKTKFAKKMQYKTLSLKLCVNCEILKESGSKLRILIMFMNDKMILQ